MRVKVPIAVIDPATGNAIAGASVQVKKRSDGTNAVLYASETGPTTSANPTVTDTYGRVSTWVDRGAYTAVISGTGLTTFNQDFDAAAASDASGETKWFATADWVTVLPTSPVNGQEIFFLADATNGVLWNLKYRAASSSSYKWECLGGGSLFASTGTSTTTSATPVLNGGPAITLPAGGDFDVTWETRAYQANSAGGATDLLVYRNGISLGVSINTFQGTAGSSITLFGGPLSRTMRVTGCVLGDVFDLRESVNTGAGTWDYRNLKITPVRVG